MEKFKVKVVAIVIMLILIAMLIPTKVLAADANIQIVEIENGDYVIYVKDLAKTEFKFAISQNELAEEVDLNYINSVKDGKEGDATRNNVVLIENATYETIKNNPVNYLYIKNGEKVQIEKLDFTQAFSKAEMAKVEKTTTRIDVETVENLVETDEVKEGIHYIKKVGGLKIIDNADSTYYFERTKLPTDKFSELQVFANKLNTEYGSMDMYSKIEFAKEFSKLYEELIEQAKWQKVENMEVKQPIEAEKGDQYIVLLKKVDKDGTETYDAQFLISELNTEKKEEQIGTEKIEVKRTSKLPITGDSLILFAILAVVVIALIVVFVRMKKLQGKENKK